jgi:hypothetical protein
VWSGSFVLFSLKKGEGQSMAKNMLFAALFLGLIGFLYWQWHLYEEKRDLGQVTSNPIIQEMTVKTSAESLHITQVFHRLNPRQDYRIIVPNHVIKWTCIKENGAPCVSKKIKSKTYPAQDSGNLTLQYSIKISPGSPSLLQSNWMMKLQNVKIHETKIELVDSFFRKGTWVAGLPLKGHKKHEFIDYYVFEGNSDQPDLYWQAKPLYIIGQNNSFTVYSEKNELKSFQKLKLPVRSLYTSFIHTNEHLPFSSPSIFITHNSLSPQVVHKIWITNYFSQKFQSKQTDNWLVDVFSSLYLNEPTKTVKGTFIIEQLRAHLNHSKIQKFVEATFQKEFINSNDLDQQLEEITGFETNFFRSNNGRSTFPLVFFETKDIKVHGKNVANLEASITNGTMFFPFIKTMKSLGYSVKVNPDLSIVLKKNRNKFIIFENQSSFLKNGQKFGLLEYPFKNENGMIYINQKGLHTLFNVKIATRNKEIYLMD